MIIANLKINYRFFPADTWWGSGVAEAGAPLRGPSPQKAVPGCFVLRHSSALLQAIILANNVF